MVFILKITTSNPFSPKHMSKQAACACPSGSSSCRLCGPGPTGWLHQEAAGIFPDHVVCGLLVSAPPFFLQSPFILTDQGRWPLIVNSVLLHRLDLDRFQSKQFFVSTVK